MTNLCLNDSQNPGFCSTWQGIGSVGSFQSAVGINLWLGCVAGGDGDGGGMDSRTASDGFSPGYVKHLLYRSRKQDPKSGTI